jgi:ribosomal protein S18 acetylase RimI-like enzyme
MAVLEDGTGSFNTWTVMKIQPAESEDVPAIARAQVRSWQAAYECIVPAEHLATLSVDKREALWRELLLRGAPELLVAKDNEYVVGFIAFGRCRDENAAPTQAEIWAFYVIPSHWSQGVGTQLWSQARERMAELGFQTVSLWVLAANTRAIGFYDHVGFDLDEDSAKEVVIGGRALSEVRYIARLR